MSEDRRRPGQHASLRDEALHPWIADAVYPYSTPLRRMLDQAGLGRRGVRTAADLRRLPVTPLADLGDGRDWLLQPTDELVHLHGDLVTRGKLLVADAVGRRGEFRRQHVDEPYKPVVWTVAPAPGGVLFVGSSRQDVDRLAALGRRGLSISGVRPDDRVLLAGSGVGVGPAQLADGCLDAGVPSLRLPAGSAPDLVASAAPTVVAGSLRSLRRLADSGFPSCVRLLLVHATTPAELVGADRLRDRTGLPLSTWWSPTGTRAAWVRCPGGEGFHTWPTHELIEAEEVGLVWSAVGWRGSVWLRVALGVTGRLDARPCATCKRTTPRVLPDLPGASSP